MLDITVIGQQGVKTWGNQILIVSTGILSKETRITLEEERFTERKSIAFSHPKY